MGSTGEPCILCDPSQSGCVEGAGVCLPDANVPVNVCYCCDQAGGGTFGPLGGVTETYVLPACNFGAR